MIKINEAVERSALTLESEQRSAASAAYLKSFMFKKTTMTAKPTTYNAMQNYQGGGYPTVNYYSIVDTYYPQSSVLNKHLTRGVFDNERRYGGYVTNFSSKIGTDKEHRVDMSTEISAVRALSPGLYEYETGYGAYGQYITGDDAPELTNNSMPLITGAGYASANNNEYLHKWDMLTDNLRVRKRLRNSRDSGGFRNMSPECEKPVTNICYAYSHTNTVPMQPHLEGKSPLSFAVFDNAVTAEDPCTGSLYKAGARMISNAPTSTMPGMTAFIAETAPATMLDKRAVHSGGLSWRGYQYAISPTSASVSTDGFDTVTELRTPYVIGQSGDVYGITSIESPTTYVYPTESGIVLQQFNGTQALTVSGTDIIFEDYSGNLAHRLLWREYYFKVENGVNCTFSFTGRRGAPDDSTFTLPTGAAFSDTDGFNTINTWIIGNTGTTIGARYFEENNDFLNDIALNLNTDREKGMALTSIVLDKSEVVVAPLREAYVKSGVNDYCIIPVAGLGGSTPTAKNLSVAALLVLNKQTHAITLVDLHGFTTVADGAEVDYFDPTNMCMVTIGDKVGLVADEEQCVLRPGEDPTVRANWVFVNTEWFGSNSLGSHYNENQGIGEGIGARTLLNRNSKYKMHGNVFTPVPYMLTQALEEGDESNHRPGETVLQLNTRDGWDQYDCYTVTDYARYPISSVGLSGTASTLITYPILREIAKKPGGNEVSDTLFIDDDTWEGFYFAVGTMVINTPAITSYDSNMYTGYDDQVYATVPYNCPILYPSFTDNYTDGYTSRPRIVGGFSIIPRNAMVGPFMSYRDGV